LGGKGEFATDRVPQERVVDADVGCETCDDATVARDEELPGRTGWSGIARLQTESNGMPTIAQVEEQILVVEGFRVQLTPLAPKTKILPSYDFTVMAPQRWRVSDWKTARLAGYVALLRQAVVQRGDGSAVKGDLQLGHIRDSYYAKQYGTTAAP